MPAALEYVAARSAGEVLTALADGNTWVLAGGQSLVLDVTSDDARPRRVVDINRVAEFDALAEVDGMVRVAPLVRHRRSAAEWPVVATMLGAQIDLAGPDGRRTVAGEHFFTGPFTTVRRPEELLAEVRLPVLPTGTGAGFAEHRRTDAKFAEVAAMAAVTVTDGLVSAAAIGLVNAGPCPVRAYAAEHALIGTVFSDATITAAAETAAGIDAKPYRRPGDERRNLRDAVTILTRRALTQARERM